ncbi:DUF4342 domain-containing protein [Bacteroidota bacterium]
MFKIISNSVALYAQDCVDKVGNFTADADEKRILIQDQSGDITYAIPLIVGTVGVMAAPVLAVVAAGLLSVNKYTISIQRKDDI